MSSPTDQQLLHDYAAHRSETAFAELTRRHVDLVFSAALRMVRDPQLAEDVTQAAFVALAKNAGQLKDRAVLSGWLHRTAQNLAANVVRSETRRRAREQEAAAMNEMFATDSGAVWENIAPDLDAALGELSDSDCDALLLRYFERKSAIEMSQILGVSDEAAQKRVNRAVERLRGLFAKRGVTVGAGGLVVLISANAVQSAPTGLALTVGTTALAGTASSTATAIATKAIAATTLQKTLVGATLAIAIAVGMFDAQHNSQLREQARAIWQQQDSLAGQVRQLESERERTRQQLLALSDENKDLKANLPELIKLRAETTRLRSEAKAAEQSSRNKLASTNLQPPVEDVETNAVYGQVEMRWGQAYMGGNMKSSPGKVFSVLAIPRRSEDGSQVIIDARIVEVPATLLGGINWDNKLNGILTPVQYDVALKNMTESGRVISTQSAAASNGGHALMTIPLTSNENNAMPVMSITPQISKDGNSVDLTIKVSATN